MESFGKQFSEELIVISEQESSSLALISLMVPFIPSNINIIMVIV